MDFLQGKQSISALLVGLILGLLLTGCGNETGYSPSFGDAPTSRQQTLLFGVHPLHNPKRLYQIYQPLVDYLNQRLPETTIKLEASRDYASYDRKLAARRFHLALPNPYQTVTALQYGYHVFGKMADDENFRGIILVRRDAGIDAVSDLHGKIISYPAPTALAATMLPQMYLQEHGLEVMRDTQRHYVGSQESAIMNVYLGKSAAGATWPPPWQAFAKERPNIAAALEVKWQTSSLPNNGLIARDDVDADLVKHIGELLNDLHTSAEGRAILAAMELSAFERATDASYAPVREFLARFRSRVRDFEDER